jgi:hypothetical protein
MAHHNNTAAKNLENSPPRLLNDDSKEHTNFALP